MEISDIPVASVRSKPNVGPSLRKGSRSVTASSSSAYDTGDGNALLTVPLGTVKPRSMDEESGLPARVETPTRSRVRTGSRSLDLDVAVSPAEPQDNNEASQPPHKPFHKWMKTLQRRAARRHRMLSPEEDLSLSFDGPAAWLSDYRRQSSSNSSSGFVAAAKSASISLASASMFTRSRRTTLLSSRGHSRADRSSRASMSGVRLSEDSTCFERSISIDPAVTERALQRRRILEELISTEESYIGDVRFLMNVYITILASLPTLPAGLRSSINRNLTDVVELHEEMLGELHRAVPFSEYTQLELPSKPLSPGIRGHHRWRSLGAVPEEKSSAAWLRDVPGMTSDPQVAAEVAKVFSRKMNRFFIYEEYGAKYELMIKDIASAHRTMPRWESYQKGLEALAASLGSANSQTEHAKKSLTIGDLLVKPIQRVCKYPLLFAELLKYTPVVDCPHAHMEIENTLIRLREATAEINRATDDSRIKAVLEKTWILQDRLAFANQMLDAASKNRVRSFGHVQLCGALHVCWQSKDSDGITGQYMIALLYRDCLCLATAGRTDQIYMIQACVALSNIKVEEVDNGRGLQCHTAPYSWKLVFICDHQLYELILTACTAKEQDEWRSRLANQSILDTHDQTQQQALLSTLSLNIKSLGTVFGKPGTIARRISIHRATTVGPKSPLCQVILKNTSVVKDAPTPSNTTQINRSQSLLTTNGRIPILAPARGERARIEALLSDVWSRDVLPFPGITARSRSEHYVRTTTSSVIRKLSVASIASTFTKRSTSQASIPKNPPSGPTNMSGISRISVHGSWNSSAREAVAKNGGAAPSSTTASSVITATAGAAPTIRTASKASEPLEDAGRSFLSVIPDESERRTVSTTSAATMATAPTRIVDSDWATDVLRTVRCLEETIVSSSVGTTVIAAAAGSSISSSSSCSLDMGKRTIAAAMVGRQSSEPPLRPPSATSFLSPHPLSRMASTVTKASSNPTTWEKENTFLGADAAAGKRPGIKGKNSTSGGSGSSASAKSHKLSNRWTAKVGVLHRDVVVQGFRSIFR